MAQRNLTRRQKEVAKLVACGLHNYEIAEMLGITARTVTFHVQSLFDLSGMSRRIELAAWFRGGFMSDNEKDAETIRMLTEKLWRSLQIMRAQEDYILKLQRELAAHGVDVPEPERQ